ncbi:hypothetical protein LZ31DRAFT_303203 [Colletotrichum somersetense]|nr:hypothetical protein LZ31DRAFT_303203 [Colletotrichum somersetense]
MECIILSAMDRHNEVTNERFEMALHWCMASRGYSPPAFHGCDDMAAELRFKKKLASYLPKARQSELGSQSRILCHPTNLFNMIKCSTRAKVRCHPRVECDDVSKVWIAGVKLTDVPVAWPVDPGNGVQCWLTAYQFNFSPANSNSHHSLSTIHNNAILADIPP